MILIRKLAHFFLSLLIVCHSLAWEECSNESEQGFCPNGNTCCKSHVGGRGVGCIPSDMGKYNGTCCFVGGGGCPVGYVCSTETEFSTEPEYICRATPSAPLADNLTQRLPRYQLGSVTKQLSRLYGLEISHHNEYSKAKLAYFSSHGPIDEISISARDSIQMVWIVIHGAWRNADDYFCSALAASQAQGSSLRAEDTLNNGDKILVVAPWFLEDIDNHTSIDESFLVWSHEDHYGPWRYAADDMYHNISSFTALDGLVEKVQEKLGPSIKIVVSGHSSGGQMVHRWSFLTKSWTRFTKAIVANPSSYLYLTPLRKMNGRWKRIPIRDCPTYNSWEWGLSGRDGLKVPYRDRALSNSSAIAVLLGEFRQKRVLYLIGSLDVCNKTDSSLLEHCHSHGLETTCMDQLQGVTRMQRSKRFMESLQYVWPNSNHYHRQVIISGVGHDHSLMWNSPEGMKAIFGGLLVGHWANAGSLEQIL